MTPFLSGQPDGRAARMVQCCQDLGFASEAGGALGIAREAVGEDLQRDIAAELRVTRAIHVPHSAGAKGGCDFVNAEACAGEESRVLSVRILRELASAEGPCPTGRAP